MATGRIIGEIRLKNSSDVLNYIRESDGAVWLDDSASWASDGDIAAEAEKHFRGSSRRVDIVLYPAEQVREFEFVSNREVARHIARDVKSGKIDSAAIGLMFPGIEPQKILDEDREE
jgi:hypothetical protein